MRHYYIFEDQQKKGPFELDKLHSMAIQKTTPVWHEGLEEWTIAGNIDEIAITWKGDEMIKLVIADDHVLYRAGVKNALSSKKNIAVVGEADNGFHLLSLLKGTHVDVILLDIQMPVMDGMTALPEIKKLYPWIKVIMLTMMVDQSMVVKLMELGAHSYLTKTSDADGIYDTIKTCHDHGFCSNFLIDKALRYQLSYGVVKQNPERPIDNSNSQRPEQMRAEKNGFANHTAVPNNGSRWVAADVAAIRSATPQIDIDAAPRERILSSFKDATEFHPAKKRNPLVAAILISILIAGIIFVLYRYLTAPSNYYLRKFFH